MLLLSTISRNPKFSTTISVDREQGGSGVHCHFSTSDFSSTWAQTARVSEAAVHTRGSYKTKETGTRNAPAGSRSIIGRKHLYPRELGEREHRTAGPVPPGGHGFPRLLAVSTGTHPWRTPLVLSHSPRPVAEAAGRHPGCGFGQPLPVGNWGPVYVPKGVEDDRGMAGAT